MTSCTTRQQFVGAYITYMALLLIFMSSHLWPLNPILTLLYLHLPLPLPTLHSIYLVEVTQADQLSTTVRQNQYTGSA